MKTNGNLYKLLNQMAVPGIWAGKHRGYVQLLVGIVRKPLRLALHFGRFSLPQIC